MGDKIDLEAFYSQDCVKALIKGLLDKKEFEQLSANELKTGMTILLETNAHQNYLIIIVGKLSDKITALVLGIGCNNPLPFNRASTLAQIKKHSFILFNYGNAPAGFISNIERIWVLPNAFGVF